MNSPRYFVAKYVSDLFRFEPQNVGVVVWTSEGTGARFRAEKKTAPGTIDGRYLPGWLDAKSAYRQWVAYWQAQLEKQSITSPDGSIEASKENPDFLDVLATSSKGNFVLAEGGVLLNRLEGDSVDSIVNYLYESLVEIPSEATTYQSPLDEKVSKAIEKSGLLDDPKYKTDYPVKCKVSDQVTETYEFSDAYGNGVPEHLCHRLALPRRGVTDQRRSVHDVAWMFEKVLDSNVVAHENSSILFYSLEEDEKDAHTRQFIDVLGSVTRVVRAWREDELLAEFESWRRE